MEMTRLNNRRNWTAIGSLPGSGIGYMCSIWDLETTWSDHVSKASSCLARVATVQDLDPYMNTTTTNNISSLCFTFFFSGRRWVGCTKENIVGAGFDIQDALPVTQQHQSPATQALTTIKKDHSLNFNF